MKAAFLLSKEAQSEIRHDILSLVGRIEKLETENEPLLEEVRYKSIMSKSEVLHALREGVNSFESRDGRIRAIVHESTYEGERYQISYFDTKGPINHVSANRIAQDTFSVANTINGMVPIPGGWGEEFFSREAG